VRQQFADTFGSLDSPENCSLVHLTISVDCVIAHTTSAVRLLLNSRIHRDIVLHGYSAALKLAVVLGQFGAFSPFRRYFVITIHDDDITEVFKYMSVGYWNAVELFT
jgi:hypothetical protein